MNIELLKRLGNLDQIAGIREIKYSNGSKKGLNCVEIYNAAGLRFTVIPDRGMDIYDFSYKGQNISFHSKNGLNNLKGTAEDEFFTQWQGGMLFTAGLSNVGCACNDDGVHPINGRIGSIPAEHISVNEYWNEDDYVLSISGEMHETRLYGRNLMLSRTITTGLYSKKISITDTITNYSDENEEFMILYHINFGYPLLDQGSRVVTSASNTVRRNEHSVDYEHISAPGAEALHQLYIHTTKESVMKTGVINEQLGLAAKVEYETTNLPFLCEWKHLAPHDYVVALEPSNCISLGRSKERENGTLKSIPPYSTVTNTLSLEIIEGKAEIKEFENSCNLQK